MSTPKKLPIKIIKSININEKISYNPDNYSTRTNDSMIIRTNNNTYNRPILSNVKKSNFLNFNQITQDSRNRDKISIYSKSAWTIEKNNIKKYKNYFSNNILLKNKNNKIKENKENQVTLIFNNSILNNYYSNININNFNKNKLNSPKIKKYILNLDEAYSPNKDYFRIIKSKKGLVNEFISQTKNNFYNNYKIIYSNADSKKRNYILNCFNSIRENKKKNIDNKNSIKYISAKEIYKNNKMSLTNRKTDRDKIKKDLLSTINIDTLFVKNNKMKIKTMKLIDDISKDNFNIEYKKQQRIKTPYYRNEDIFKTLPKYKRSNYNNIFLSS